MERRGAGRRPRCARARQDGHRQRRRCPAALLGRRHRPAARRAHADVLVTTARVGPRTDPHENLMCVDERAVRLVLVGGRPVLGATKLLTAAGALHVEPLDVGGVRKGVVMRLPDELVPPDPVLQAEANASWADGLSTLQRVVDDPAAAVRAAKSARAPPGRADPRSSSPPTCPGPMPAPAGAPSPTTSSSSSSSPGAVARPRRGRFAAVAGQAPRPAAHPAAIALAPVAIADPHQRCGDTRDGAPS